MKYKKYKIKISRKDYYKNVRNNKIYDPITPFEKVYYYCFSFKKLYKNECKENIIEKLIELSKIIVDETYRYNKIRGKKHYGNHKSCFVCKEYKADYQHHIIMLINGGYDNGINRIPICHSCHIQIHSWMK